MSKKIVILAGSPRENGNSIIMTKHFMDEAQKKGHDIVLFQTAFLKIGSCVACERCYENGNACYHEDDFNMIAEEIIKADLIVFSMPVYWYSIPGNLKNVIDKFYSFVVSDRCLKGKKCALLCCCEENNLKVMEGIRIPYEKIAECFRWKSIGEILIPGVGNIGEILKTDVCKQVEELVFKI